MKKIKNAIRNVLYGLGVFSLIHVVRNRRTLTAFMFHRVLPMDSVEFRNAEREFTFSVESFGRCLDFIQKHYYAITLDDLRRAQEGECPLPDRAALITFDDGWRDTLIYAAPELTRRNLNAVLFVASEVPTQQQDRWWQDALVTVLADRLATSKLLHRLQLPNSNNPETIDRLALNALISQMSETERMTILSESIDLVSMPRQMLNTAELQQIKDEAFELGAHGHTHAPLTAVMQPAMELEDSLRWLKSVGSKPLSMSFPHGAFNLELASAARQVGFQLIFTSAPELLDTNSQLDDFATLGRIHIPENEWTCDKGEVSFPLLATFLFFRPKVAPA